MGSTFFFKQFSVRQEISAMKVGTDGTLLGAWANVSDAESILDVGTGTGLLALMCAQRNKNATIHALEIYKNAATEANFNFGNSPWAERLNCILQDFQTWESSVRFEHIICNPPFFNVFEKHQAKAGRKLARSQSAFSFEKFFDKAARVAKESAKLSIIIPYENMKNCVVLAEQNDWYIWRICRVLPTPGKKAKRVLIEWRRNTCGSFSEKEIILELSRHVYSPEAKKLFAPFYLKMA